MLARLSKHHKFFCIIDHDFSYAIEPVKLLSKKEQKRLEDEEFDRVMAEMGSQKATAAAATEESKKQPAAAEGATEIDEKKRLANLKKK